jgi:uncharacterized protein
VVSERVQFPCGDITLEGMFEVPPGVSMPVRGVAVCHPHPLYGGDMHNDVVNRVCRGLLEQGCAALRFNFRGVLASGGEHAGGYGEREDVWAALDWLRSRHEIDGARLGLAGYSFGAAVALNAGIAAGVRALAAISVPPQMVDFTALQGYEIPVLLIAGDQDQFVPVEPLQQLAIAVGASTTTAIVRGTDHFWSGRIGQLGEAVGSFFAANL